MKVDFDIYKLINGEKNIAQPEKKIVKKLKILSLKLESSIVFLNESELSWCRGKKII